MYTNVCIVSSKEKYLLQDKLHVINSELALKLYLFFFIETYLNKHCAL